MEQSSFYGGRKGTSFVIVKNYPDIPTMVTAFKQGSAYTIVNFDEYVLINAVNKNHPDNGKIFRRGYDYNNGNRKIAAYRAYVATTDEQGHPIADETKEIIDGKYYDSTSGTWTEADYHSAVYEYTDAYEAGGAIYIGTIAGPSGRAPHLHMATYDQVEHTHAGESFEEYETHGSYTLDNEDLLPGKYESNGTTLYNDEIQWYCVSIRDNNNEDAEAYIGLKIPYPVIDFTTEAIDPYNGQSEYTDTSNIERIDDKTHPFYEKWRISIPKGIQGNTLKNFRVITPTEDDIIYTIGTTDPYEGYQDDIENERQILVYDYYHYDNSSTGEPVTYYIGDYNLIDSFDIADNGDVSIVFTHGDNIILPGAIKRIENATFEMNELDNACVLTLEYNTTNEEGQHEIDSFPLDWVKGLTVAEDGSVYVSYTMDGSNREDGVESFNNLIKWINDITLVTQGNNQGAFAVSFNNNASDFTASLHWINDISLSNTGIVTCSYSQGNETKAPKVLNTPIKWINNISVNNNGTLTVTYNTQTNGINNTQVFNQAIKWVDDVDMDQYGVITTTYNTLDNQGNHNTKVFDDPVRWINSINLTPDGILTVTYNTRTGQTTDTWTSQNKIKYLDNVTLSDDGYITLIYNTTDEETGEPQTETFLNQLKWINDARVTDGLFEVKYNTEENYDLLTTLKYVTDITLAQNGLLTLTYNTKVEGQPQTSDLVQGLRWINSVTFSDGNLTVNYNDNSTDTVASSVNFIKDINVDGNTGKFTVNYTDGSVDDSYTTTLKYPNGLSVNTGESGNQRLHVTYTNNSDGEDIGDPLNFIERTKITSDNHLIVLYSDPAKRTGSNLYHQGEAIDGRTGWIDLGSVISDRDGVLVGTNFTWAQIYAPNEVPSATDLNDAIKFLNEKYPTGFLNGKIATVGNAGEEKYFFGFDYNYIDSSVANPEYKKWYYIGPLAPVEASVSSFIENVNVESVSPLYPTGTLWFVSENLYDITYNFTNVTSSNKYARVRQGYNYTNVLTPSATMILSSVIITMDETTIYNSSEDESFDPSSYTINIASVTGDITITATAKNNE